MTTKMKIETWKADNGRPNMVGVVGQDLYFKDIYPSTDPRQSSKTCRAYGISIDRCEERAQLIASAPKMREDLYEYEAFIDWLEKQDNYKTAYQDFLNTQK